MAQVNCASDVFEIMPDLSKPLAKKRAMRAR
jgi:hypothetical protein